MDEYKLIDELESKAIKLFDNEEAEYTLDQKVGDDAIDQYPQDTHL